MKRIHLRSKKGRKKNTARNLRHSWLGAILSGLLLIFLLRTFVFQLYIIPSPAMAGTLLPGDVVLVNKLVVGARIPQTLSFPHFANQLPADSGSYLQHFKLPYLRLPAFPGVRSNQIMVYNNPNDTLPVDVQRWYIGRMVALPGDSVMIFNKRVLINDSEFSVKTARYAFTAATLNSKAILKLIEPLGLDEAGNDGEQLELYIDSVQLNKLTQAGIPLKPATFWSDTLSALAPNGWNIHFLGPVIVPAKGMTLKRDSITNARYRGLIRDFSKFPNETYYNSRYAQYFILCDNRDNGHDSRHWGYIPETHIIGRIDMVLFSINTHGSGLGKLRWKRWFHRIR